MNGYGEEKQRSEKGRTLFEHMCMSKGCEKWGTFGYATRYGQLWFCRSHRQKGEDALAGRGK